MKMRMKTMTSIKGRIVLAQMVSALYVKLLLVNISPL